MSPSIFINLYAEKLLEEALRNTPGTQVDEEHVKNLKYADDQGVLAKSERALQDMIDNINEAGKRFNMKINAGKTKVMKIGKRERIIHLTLEGQELEQVENFRYLGGLIKLNGHKLHRRNQKQNRNGEDSIRERERLTDRKKDTAEAEEDIC